jgi:hypothetical protein
MGCCATGGKKGTKQFGKLRGLVVKHHLPKIFKCTSRGKLEEKREQWRDGLSIPGTLC